MAGQPHDALFHATFSHVESARGVLRSILPSELSGLIDWSTLALESAHLTTAGLESRRADLLFSALLVNGRGARLLLLFEHQSRVTRWMAFRGLEYMVGTWRAFLRDTPRARHLPPVIPIVLHHGDGDWTAQVEFHDLFGLDPEALGVLGPYLPSFRHWVEELGARDSGELLALPATPEARMTLFCLKRVRQGEVFFDELPAFRAACEQLQQTVAGRQALRHILSYIQQVTDVPRAHVVDRVLAALGPETKEEFVTLAEQLIQEGMQKGMQQGMQKGMQQGMQKLRDLVMKQLTLAFGELDEDARARLMAADLDELTRYGERVVDARCLDEVFGEPAP